MIDHVEPKGRVKAIVEHDDGRIETIEFDNHVLRTGRAAIAASMGNKIGSSYEFYISKMLFGDGGTSGGVPRVVNDTRNGLFGTVRASNPVITSIDPEVSTKLHVTSVLKKADAVGYTITELALQMGNDDLYSMATFGGLSKTSTMQITFVWALTW